MRNTIQLTTLILILVTAGCGFHPRGALPTLPSELNPLKIEGVGLYHPFRRILRERLLIAGATLDSQDANAATLHLHRITPSRQLLSVDERNKKVEYEISVTLVFSVSSAENKVVLPQQNLVARRILFNPGTQLLGRSNEEELLRKDMYQELSDRMISRINYQLR